MALRETEERSTLRHLSRMTDDRGIFEHALGSHPRFTHGYCTDDNARLLVVTSRDRDGSLDAAILSRVAARFLIDSISSDGQVHNRMSFERMWIDAPSVEDCWGRCLWGLGTAVALADDYEVRNRCYEAFELASRARSPYLRSMCFAAIGAAEVLSVDPANLDAFELLADVAAMISTYPVTNGGWPWPENRLRYANGLIPEVMIACGRLLGDDKLLRRGLGLLEWLVDIETGNERLSVTPAGGRGPGELGPAFDQQPIEVAAIADAAARAGSVSGDMQWDQVLSMASSWFLGNNDSEVSMIDPDSGGGYDGLEDGSVNLNQGAESTLAMISTLQHRELLWVL